LSYRKVKIHLLLFLSTKVKGLYIYKIRLTYQGGIGKIALGIAAKAISGCRNLNNQAV
jgi:hypothetical protein